MDELEYLGDIPDYLEDDVEVLDLVDQGFPEEFITRIIPLEKWIQKNFFKKFVILFHATLFFLHGSSIGIFIFYMFHIANKRLIKLFRLE